MSVIDSGEFPALAVPRRPEGPTSLRLALRAMRENALSAHAPENFEADIITQRILWRRMFIINEPNAIRYVVLNNACLLYTSLVSAGSKLPKSITPPGRPTFSTASTQHRHCGRPCPKRKTYVRASVQKQSGP